MRFASTAWTAVALTVFGWGCTSGEHAVGPESRDISRPGAGDVGGAVTLGQLGPQIVVSRPMGERGTPFEIKERLVPYPDSPPARVTTERDAAGLPWRLTWRQAGHATRVLQARWQTNGSVATLRGIQMSVADSVYELEFVAGEAVLTARDRAARGRPRTTTIQMFRSPSESSAPPANCSVDANAETQAVCDAQELEQKERSARNARISMLKSVVQAGVACGGTVLATGGSVTVSMASGLTLLVPAWAATGAAALACLGSLWEYYEKNDAFQAARSALSTCRTELGYTPCNEMRAVASPTRGFVPNALDGCTDENEEAIVNTSYVGGGTPNAGMSALVCYQVTIWETVNGGLTWYPIDTWTYCT